MPTCDASGSVGRGVGLNVRVKRVTGTELFIGGIRGGDEKEGLEVRVRRVTGTELVIGGIRGGDEKREGLEVRVGRRRRW